MSAFIVNPGCMSDAVAVLMSGTTIKSEAARKAITKMQFNRLYAMNARSIKARYGEDSDVSAFKPVAPSENPFQLLRSIQCLIYQCAEGDVPQEKLFKKLSEASGKLEAELKKKFRGANFRINMDKPEIVSDRTGDYATDHNG